jgi:2,5-diketo-D-gluconate reductase A
MRLRTSIMNRRQFLRTSTASAILMGIGGKRLFAANATDVAQKTVPTVTLNNGLKMPRIGLGTMTLRGDLGVRRVADAISLGYRLIDTATVYNSEPAVGEGIRQSGIRREELFLTSKLWKSDMGYDKTRRGFQTSIDKMKVDYLDLYLIHRPLGGDWQGSWRAMEELYHEGRIRAIGMSNADFAQMSELISNFEIKPAVHQIETHAFFQETDAYAYLRQHGVQIEAWSPFAEGRHGLFTNEALAAVARKHGKSVAQVCLRWHFQRGVVAIPLSTQKAHLAENVDIFDFSLDESDLASISSLDLNKTQFPEWS